jgi:hypothetical protein
VVVANGRYALHGSAMAKGGRGAPTAKRGRVAHGAPDEGAQASSSRNASSSTRRSGAPIVRIVCLCGEEACDNGSNWACLENDDRGRPRPINGHCLKCEEFSGVLGISVQELHEEMAKKKRLDTLLEQRDEYYEHKGWQANGKPKDHYEEEVYELVSHKAYYLDRAFVSDFSMGANSCMKGPVDNSGPTSSCRYCQPFSRSGPMEP